MATIPVLFFFVLFASFFCSLLEAVFLSITPAHVSISARDGKKWGLLLEHLKENIDRPISAILTMNTLVNTMGSAGFGAIATQTYGPAVATTLTIFLGCCVLIFSEIIPKIVGATYWKEMAPFAVYAIQGMIFLLYPVVRASEVLSKKISNTDSVTVTREEVITTAEMGADDGTLAKKESTIIKNLLMLDSIFVSDIMTPRSVMFCLEDEMTNEEVIGKFKPLKFSRIPVYHEDLDHIVGLTFRYKILEASSRDQHQQKISELTTPIQSVPERMPVAALIDLLIKRKEHLALVLDEYGIVTGLVTLEDAIETLLGVEIVDEFDTITDMRQYALDQWQVRKNKLRRS